MDFCDDYSHQYFEGIQPIGIHAEMAKREISRAEYESIRIQRHHYWIQMFELMEKSRQEILKVADPDIRSIGQGIIEGAIAGASTRSFSGAAITAAIAGLARLGSDTYGHIHNAWNYMRQSQQAELQFEYYDQLLRNSYYRE